MNHALGSYGVIEKNRADFIATGGNILAGGAWDHPGLRRALEDVLPKEQAFESLEIAYKSPSGVASTLILNGRRLENGLSGGSLILLAVESHSLPGDGMGGA